MKLIKNIDNKLFIFENVLHPSLIDLLLERCKNNIHERNFVARFSLIDDSDPNNNTSFNKLFTELNDNEIHTWNNFKNNGSKRIGRKDIETPLNDYSLRYTINEQLKEYLQIIYGEYLKDYYVQTEDILTYQPGHLMNLHSDSNPNNPRLCTTTLYLNEMKDEYEGGEIIFYDNITGFESPEVIEKSIIYKHRPQKNQLVIFDSYFNENGIQHSVTEIKNWNRDVLRTYWQQNPKQH
jgi:Rps23 Pro-64 3,4-dihydroxylase Tpa1-like proline 4-hydroxylase